MSFIPDEDALDAALREALGGQPPRADFAAWRAAHSDAVRLLRALRAAEGQAGGRWPIGAVIGEWIMRHKTISATAAAAVLAGLAILVWQVRDGSGARDGRAAPDSAARPPGGGDGGQVAVAPPPARPGAAMYFPPPAIQVACSEAVVRATMQSLTNDHIVCKVMAVIYGDVPCDLLHVGIQALDSIARAKARQRLGRDPNEAEARAALAETVNFQPGRQAIFYLDQCRRMDGAVACRKQGAAYDAPPKHRLDDLEKELVEIIRTGKYLSLPEEYPDQYLGRSELVMRATLEKVTGDGAEWKVASQLYAGQPGRSPTMGWGFAAAASQPTAAPPREVRVSLVPWRLRAECIVRYRPGAPAGQPPDAELVHREFDKLVKAELPAGLDAILFLRARPDAKGNGPCGLIGVLRGDPAKPGDLDRLEKKLRREIETGEYRIQKL